MSRDQRHLYKKRKTHIKSLDGINLLTYLKGRKTLFIKAEAQCRKTLKKNSHADHGCIKQVNGHTGVSQVGAKGSRGTKNT